MNENVYGIDPDGEVTPLMVRDALAECFYQAHCADSGVNPEDRKLNSDYCKSIVEKAFAETGGDFQKPAKQSIMNAIGWLGEFSTNFRDPKIIQEHAASMMKLVEKMK